MTATYDLIASNVLTTSASSVTFSSIPATYRDLVVVANYIPTAASNGAIRLNNNADSYSSVFMEGNGSVARSSTGSSSQITFEPFITLTSGQSQLVIINIMDYSATDKHKSVLLRANPASQQVVAWAARFASTSAVNRLDFIELNGNGYPAGSSFQIYGIVS